MALKKGMFESYIKEREAPSVSTKTHSSSKYSHNRVFDEPESLKKVLDNVVTKEHRKDNSNKSLSISNNQTVSNGFKSDQAISNTATEPLNDCHANTTSPENLSMFHAEHQTIPLALNAFNHDSNGFIRFQTVSNKAISKDDIAHKTDSIGFNRFQSNSIEPSSGPPQLGTDLNESRADDLIRVQTVSNETVSNGFNRVQTVSGETVSNDFNRVQTVSETVSKRPSVSEIKILYYFQENRDENGTFIVQRNQIAKAVNLKLAGVKTALIRLKTKGYIVLKTSSRGRYTGYTSYILTPLAHQILSFPDTLNLLGFKRLQTVSETVSTTSISSSNIINTTTSLPDEWKKINYDLLSHIGFCQTQLLQLYNSNMTVPEIVQDAINRFAYSLQYNDKAKAYTDPLNVLMGVLRKGMRWNEPNYVPPKELSLRQILEEKRRVKEDHDRMIKELIELEFPEWKRKLTQEEIKKIVPEDVRKTNLTSAIQATLRVYFTEKVLLPRLKDGPE